MGKKKGRILGTNAQGLPYNGRAFTATSLQEYRLRSQQDYEAMRTAKREAIIARLRSAIRRREDGTLSSHDSDSSEDDWEDVMIYNRENVDIEMLNRVMQGKEILDISNAGGEVEEMIQIHMIQEKRKKPRDKRARRDAVEKQVAAFMYQLPWMVKAYLKWSYEQDHHDDATVPGCAEVPEGKYPIRKLDTYSTAVVEVPLYATLPSLAASCIQQGIIPCAPDAPTIGVTIQTLELFHSLSMRCPHLSIQAFVKSLCDMHKHPYRGYLSKQFSTCYDVYLQIIHAVEKEVSNVLGRGDPNWRLNHACVPCTYKLKGEPALKYSMLLAMDGNNSLKRLARTVPKANNGEGDGEPSGGGEGRKNVERSDPRVVDSDYYLPRDEVDSFGDDTKEQIPSKGDAQGDPNQCDDRWKNMAEEHTSKMWGVFEETGVFLVLCRHGHVMMVMDMVRTGEQTKYPLAAVNRLIDAFGSDLGIGYDIGCQFAKTLQRSRLAHRARQFRTSCLVGSFHGHAHNRICQLRNLATYVEGLGLEDLEGCERFFSKSNALASSTRHASIFHRRQKINEYIKHMDRKETYLALSAFIVANYKQALDILSREPVLVKQMNDQHLGTNPSIFQKWRDEEYTYLTNLKREPMQETLHMEYYEKLRAFYKSESRLAEIMDDKWYHQAPTTNVTTDERSTRARETARRHIQERHIKNMEIVQGLERELEIAPEKRWLPGDKEWEEAKELVAKRRYQRAVDHLESLVVARMFELTKMNMSRTGYKMRQHIGKALKSRSTAIQTALKEFNEAAIAIGRSTITWDQVVQYAQLADFDLLSDTREDVRKRPWAKPGSRQLLDQYFKILRAQEEVIRLNVEIRRLSTYIRDEEAYLAHVESSLQATHPLIAHQISRQRLALVRMNDIHIARLKSLATLDGFTGSLDEGGSLEPPFNIASTTSTSPLNAWTSFVPPASAAPHLTRNAPPLESDSDLAAEEEEEEDLNEQEAFEVAFAVMSLGDDK